MNAAPNGRILVILALIFCAKLGAQSPAPAHATPARDDLLPPEADPVALPDTPSRKQVLQVEASPRQDQLDGFKLKVDVNLVLVEATVRGEYGGIVDGLTREDFRVSENGVEQDLRYFSRDELPLAVALVVDRSGSMAPVIRELRHAAYDAIARLKPDDRVAVFAFAARAEQLQGLTADRQRIADAIARIHAGGSTVIPDALYEAAQYLARAAPNRRHAIILISDNENTLEGYTNESKVTRLALETETVIYSVKIGEGMQAHYHGWPVLLPLFRDVSVAKITRETGGEVIEASNDRMLQSAMATVISRLKQRYTLGYQTTNHRRDGAFRPIEIRVGQGSSGSPSRYSVYARRGYYAPVEQRAERQTKP